MAETQLIKLNFNIIQRGNGNLLSDENVAQYCQHEDIKYKYTSATWHRAEPKEGNLYLKLESREIEPPGTTVHPFKRGITYKYYLVERKPVMPSTTSEVSLPYFRLILRSERKHYIGNWGIASLVLGLALTLIGAILSIWPLVIAGVGACVGISYQALQRRTESIQKIKAKRQSWHWSTAK